MCVAFGMSLKSEKEAFDKAMEMLKHIAIEIESVRLDKYYSSPSYVDRFGKAKVYVIPKKCNVEWLMEMERYNGRIC